MFYNVVVVI